MKNYLEINDFFTKGAPVWETVQWGNRDAEITDESGNLIFREDTIQAPIHWSDTAVNIVASKYFTGRPGEKDREHRISDMIWRVAHTISEWGYEQGYFDENGLYAFEGELIYILLHQMASFNSPVWFNVGVESHPQTSACFILGVEDNMESIFDWYRNEGMIFKYGSGAGINLSSLRSSKESISGGGTASGPLSFMKAADASAGVIKSGGKLRRAAKNVILDIDHPDIEDFIKCKVREEEKVKALIAAGFDGAIGGEAYSGAHYQNANHTVRIPDSFLQIWHGNGDWYLTSRREKKFYYSYAAREVFKWIVESVHACGDPGIYFADTVRMGNTCPNSGKIHASNPCQEFLWHDNSSCNLASIKLTAFWDGEKFDIEAFRHTVDIMITAQDILIDKSKYPTEKIAENSRKFRPLGLGYTDLGALLMRMGVPYDSDEGRNVAASITALMTGEAYCQSARLATVKKPFEEWSKNEESMYRVVDLHKFRTANLHADDYGLSKKAAYIWEFLGHGARYRNSQVTLLAPTGTISFMLDCDTTGIEPEIGLVKTKKLAGGGEIIIVNKSVKKALTQLGYKQAKIDDIDFHLRNGEPINDFILEEHMPIFQCALGDNYLSPEAHIYMMAAVQPFLSGGISKTVNLPNNTTIERIEELIIKAWKKGLKAITFYRSGCKAAQPITVQGEKERRSEEGEIIKPMRNCLPVNCNSIRHKFEIAGFKGYLHVGFHEDGTPGEIFTTVSKEGSTVAGLMDTISTLTSLALQYGVPLDALVKKFSHVRFEPSGMTGNPDIPIAKSLIDYIFRWLGTEFLTEEKQKEIGLRNGNGNGEQISNDKISEANICPDCGSIMNRSGNCYTCPSCGGNTGCG